MDLYLLFSSRSTELVQKVIHRLLKKLVTLSGGNVAAPALCPTESSTVLADIGQLISCILNEPDALQILPWCLRETMQDLSRWITLLSDKQFSDEGSHTRKLFDLGRCWTIVGILQVFLLAPQGPVDPVHKLAVELKHKKEQVCF